jgi:hypothetical protein
LVLLEVVNRDGVDMEALRLMLEAVEVRAVIKTEADELLLDILRSCTLDKSLQTSELELSVLETEPMGLRLEDVSSSEVEE